MNLKLAYASSVKLRLRKFLKSETSPISAYSKGIYACYAPEFVARWKYGAVK